VAQNNSNVLKQAILHLSAVHVSNFLFAFGNPDRAILFSTEAEKRRSMTLKALRVSAAQEDKDACVATAPVIMLLLTLSAVSRLALVYSKLVLLICCLCSFCAVICERLVPSFQLEGCQQIG
jgi:hypothetical protein